MPTTPTSSGAAPETRDNKTRDDELSGPSPGARALLTRHRLEAGAVAALVVAGWSCLLWAALHMSSPLARLMMPMEARWSIANGVAVYLMWAVMMAAMMLPSAMPMILTFAHLNRRNGTPSHSHAFIAAYVVMWSAFSLAATLMQWAAQAGGVITPMLDSRSVTFSAVLLLIAGVFQFTPLKQACLKRCRSPIGFLMTDWREGVAGAWRMGLRHGLYCIGCCAGLMLLLFVGGVMNILWIAALATLVALEKLLPAGEKLARWLGIGLLLAGVWHLLRLA